MICKFCGKFFAGAVTNCPDCVQMVNGDSIYGGTILADRYEIVEVIKGGGMARVYKAIDHNLSLYLAIKELSNTFFNNEQKHVAIEKFSQEAKFLAKLRHPALPVVHDYFVAGNNYYIVMDFIEGCNIEEIIKSSSGPLSIEEVVSAGLQMCDILDYLHNQTPPVIHRDIKPSNFIKSAGDGKIKLVDFGIARFYDSQTTGTLVGTIGYSPPEQFRGITRPQSDIYSLGVTLYRMATGRPPETIETLSHNPDIMPEFLFSLIQKAVSIKINDRFFTPLEMKKVMLNRENGFDCLTSHTEKSGDFVISCKKEEGSLETVTRLVEKKERLPGRIPPPKKRIEILAKKIKEAVPIDIDLINRSFSLTEFQGSSLDKLKKSINQNLCVDIGPYFIKIIRPVIDNNILHQSFMTSLETPSGVFKNGKFSNPHPVAKLLKDFLRKNNIIVNGISFSKSPSFSLLRTLILPKSEESNLVSVIKNYIEPSIPFPYKEANVECYITSRYISGDEGYMKVFVTAMNKEYINNLISLSSLMGLKLNHILSSHKANLNVMRLMARKLDKLAIIDFGYDSTDITIIKNGLICQSNFVEGGLNDFIRALSIGKQVPMSKAQEILEVSDIDITRADKENMKFYHIIIPAVKNWLTSLLGSFSSLGIDYKMRKDNYSFMILCGDGAYVKSLDKFIGNEFGIPCFKFFFSENNIEKSSSFMSCLGLSLEPLFGEADNPGEKVELKSRFWSSIFGV